MEDKDINIVDVEVVTLKEEFQPETTNHSQDMPVLEERTMEQFVRPEVRRPGVKRLEAKRLEVKRSDDDKPLPKRRRMACFKTFVISTA